MLKLIYTSSFNEGVEAGASLFTNTSKMKKQASTVFNTTYDSIKPPKGKVAIHLIALGDEEAYGPNRNADGFPKQANLTRHHTFKTNGHVFEHHRNTDPKKKLGDVIKAAYNEPMSRVELIIHADENKAAKHLARMEKEGSVPVSMACSVPNDRCSICGTLRKSTSDPNQCDHVKHSLGKMAEDGSLVYVHNDKPTFFDISFVTKPADRTAYGFKVASANTDFISSTDLAAEEGILLPTYVKLEDDTARSRRNLIEKMADFENYYKNYFKSIDTKNDYYTKLASAAIGEVDEDTLSKLRKYEPRQLLKKLAHTGVILPIRSFYKYAFSSDYDKIASYVDDAVAYLRSGVYSKLQKSASIEDICNDNYFLDIPYDPLFYVPDHLIRKVAEDISFSPNVVPVKVISNIVKGATPSMSFVKSSSAINTVAKQLATRYVNYKVAMLQEFLDNNKYNVDERDIIALSVAQDLFNY